MTRHDGTPALPDADYLVPADPAIGPVISAETNRKQGGWYPVDRAFRKLMIEIGSLCLVLGGLLGALLVHARGPMDLLPWTPGLSGAYKAVVYGIAVASAIVGFFAALPFRRRRSSYVGRLGLQSYAQGRFSRGKRRVVCFSACAKLQVLRTRHHLNGSYTHTAFHYAWFDSQGVCAFVIDGKYDDRAAPRSSDRVLFALAAEKAWLRTR